GRGTAAEDAAGHRPPRPGATQTGLPPLLPGSVRDHGTPPCARYLNPPPTNHTGKAPNGTAVPRSAAGDFAAAPTSSPRSATDARLAPPQTGLAPPTSIAAHRRPDR